MVTNWEACLIHLLGVPVPRWRGNAKLASLLNALDRNELAASDAKQYLAKIGLGLLLPGELLSKYPPELRAPRSSVHSAIERTGSAGYLLAVPNSSPSVSALFEGTRWAASWTGVGLWKDALHQSPRHIVITDKRCNRMHIGKVQRRCALVILNELRKTGLTL